MSPRTRPGRTGDAPGGGDPTGPDTPGQVPVTAAPPGQDVRYCRRTGPDPPRSPPTAGTVPRLTDPQTRDLSERDHHQAVTVLASMIARWVAGHDTETPGSHPEA